MRLGLALAVAVTTSCIARGGSDARYGHVDLPCFRDGSCDDGLICGPLATCVRLPADQCLLQTELTGAMAGRLDWGAEATCGGGTYLGTPFLAFGGHEQPMVHLTFPGVQPGVLSDDTELIVRIADESGDEWLAPALSCTATILHNEGPPADNRLSGVGSCSAPAEPLPNDGSRADVEVGIIVFSGGVQW